jgi:hypothetical protein
MKRRNEFLTRCFKTCGDDVKCMMLCLEADKS